MNSGIPGNEAAIDGRHFQAAVCHKVSDQDALSSFFAELRDLVSREHGPRIRGTAALFLEQLFAFAQNLALHVLRPSDEADPGASSLDHGVSIDPWMHATSILRH